MRKGKNIFWGLLFVLGAVFILVNRLGYFEGISIVTVIFTIIIAGALIDSIFHRSFGGILFSLAFLCILYDELLGIENLTPWPVLAAALCGTIGLNMIFKEKKRNWKCEKHFEWDNETYKDIIDEESDEEEYYYEDTETTES